jgi:RNA polymerase sigma-70 factor (ECF subfamily)
MKRMSRQDELYEQAAEAHKHALERLARAYEINADKQRDLLQEIHLALWQSFARYEGKCSVRTWVYRVAHNTAASHVLREHRANAKQWLSLEDVESMPDADMPQESANRRLVLDRLLELIRRLKPVERQLMLLYLEDMDAESIGEIAGMSAGNVRVQVHRIKAVLARQFHGGSTHEQ